MTCSEHALGLCRARLEVREVLLAEADIVFVVRKAHVKALELGLARVLLHGGSLLLGCGLVLRSGLLSGGLRVGASRRTASNHGADHGVADCGASAHGHTSDEHAAEADASRAGGGGSTSGGAAAVVVMVDFFAWGCGGRRSRARWRRAGTRW